MRDEEGRGAKRKRKEEGREERKEQLRYVDRRRVVCNPA